VKKDHQFTFSAFADGVPPFKVFDVHSILNSPEQNFFIDVFQWLEQRICKPHRDLGRDGNVCPFAGKSMRANAMRFVGLRGVRGSATDAKDVCLRLIDLFWNVFPPEPVDELQTLVAIFPDLPKDEAAVFIDGGHKLVRHQFLAAGLALGEFHSVSETQGVHNPDFNAMWAPLPVFIIRRISKHDALFLGRGDYPAEERIASISAFLKHFSGSIDHETEAKLVSLMEFLKASATNA
jgi:hypothetical protein